MSLISNNWPQTVRLCSLICAFVVEIGIRQMKDKSKASFYTGLKVMIRSHEFKAAHLVILPVLRQTAATAGFSKLMYMYRLSTTNE